MLLDSSVFLPSLLLTGFFSMKRFNNLDRLQPTSNSKYSAAARISESFKRIVFKSTSGEFSLKKLLERSFQKWLKALFLTIQPQRSPTTLQAKNSLCKVSEKRLICKKAFHDAKDGAYCKTKEFT